MSFAVVELVRNIVLKNVMQLCTFRSIEGPLHNANTPVNPILPFDTGFESHSPNGWMLSKSPDVRFLTSDAGAIDARLLPGPNAYSLAVKCTYNGIGLGVLQRT